MLHIRQYLTDHYNVYLLAGIPLILVWIWARFAWAYFRQKRRGEIFPPSDSVPKEFHEQHASGSSDKSLRSRLAGASRCLEIIVTDDEVWVRPAGLFFPESDLEHRIPRAAIFSAELARTFLNRPVRLGFYLPTGDARRLKLVVRDPEAFLAALKMPQSMVAQPKPV